METSKRRISENEGINTQQQLGMTETCNLTPDVADYVAGAKSAWLHCPQYVNYKRN